MKEISGGITAAKGFMAASAAAGIKYQGRTDMALVYSKKPCVSAGTFTSNVVKAACVQWDMEIVKSEEPLQAVVINSGIANACTGKEGFDACEATAKAVEAKLNVPFKGVAVASTGVIGMQLPVDKLVNGVNMMAAKLDESIEAGTDASKAIMTTDTVNKEIAVEFEISGKKVVLGGMSKGSGMIHPNMCTMLAFLGTDLAIEKSLLQEAVSDVVADTFNMITVDGDTSTNDTLICMANGLAENPKITEKGEDYNTFKAALAYVCEALAKKMAADGEGASKLFEATVVNAKSKEDAKTLSRAIVSSNLSKAAIFGCDANFGRFLCAMGYSGADFDQNDVELYFKSVNGTLKVFDKGTPIVFDEDEALKIMKADSVTVYVDMHEGNAEATAWGCDLTYDYVKINADYRS
ncbi:MAG: bifunctional glutamate N-acetyltransferase/amino-acid acetyltransferase ArgJ [Pseudobutyrivibrio sp.]|uniref:bifunctional glutamate N-acetyltransferase/amino-acid acetyltransferase ArgJ n=1 Tax=Pseudobutyrivibrio sp. TaxID=2014367 RepID=UPI001B215F65|nr:bifunctional glutamate N-acetyltransferase/amino-acid acetyltransferase ArgJ [Pseudobutyrivibrio sp.]MBO5617843.1 bifunctional glutamate N-acetyltransferase/amino-acid acetyltransferase ArgJ [Pseudobutyrivibrio sp.]MBO6283371.1 bifunctional glutamate N-acetyltransferase/amino-acid acetyltransferase ArgJ [Pseudobutyrivibrio sp.]MBP3263370.1 bifunctional glutamate N-acetyltransferase/amino-acid acetyltransferase ArgJ [Pseudobutyrivibrio sp.]